MHPDLAQARHGETHSTRSATICGNAPQLLTPVLPRNVARESREQEFAAVRRPGLRDDDLVGLAVQDLPRRASCSRNRSQRPDAIRTFKRVCDVEPIGRDRGFVDVAVRRAHKFGHGTGVDVDVGEAVILYGNQRTTIGAPHHSPEFIFHESGFGWGPQGLLPGAGRSIEQVDAPLLLQKASERQRPAVG